MILYNNIVKIFKNLWIGYMLKVAFLLASTIFFQIKIHCQCYHSYNDNVMIVRGFPKAITMKMHHFR